MPAHVHDDVAVIDELVVDGDDEHTAVARTGAVLAVLGGVSPGTVARRYGVAEQVLSCWVDTFVGAGRESLADEARPELHAARNAARDQHLAMVAHELRSPLAMIRGWAELMVAEEDPSEVVHRASTGILRQADRLARLADDALDATSVALGHLGLDLEVHDLGQMVGQIVDARPLDRPTLVVEEALAVSVDAGRFGQVLDNLLENVRKHVGEPARMEVRRNGVHGEVVITSDGPPIAPELARRLFEPFERGTTAAGGMGLGLYVCRALIVAHGGQIGLEVDGTGNHFWLRLPIRLDQPDAPGRSPVTT